MKHIRRVTGLAVAASLVLGLSLAWASTFTVRQKDRAFSEREVRLRQGESVTFVNEDAVTHNVYSVTRGLEFEIKTQTPGQTDTVRFARAGTVEVLCAIHPKMKLLVHVAP